ncbi:putative mitochondrial protein [Vitis vinifera]|uniref:Putative mitochondrial protein n=1 Tax=Vitis vinifera TaxID=29760 RepID=A0A438D0E5_VITVI|nr:putative mitochondrial protein [Vitis vinifera]
MMKNDKGEDVFTRLTTGWRVCIDYRRLNAVTRNYHFPLPFIDQDKCHFMVHQGIVLRHIISKQGIEVDKAKVELIVKLPSPTNIKGVRQFLGHVRFYRRFIKDFSKLERPLCELLVKDAKFIWDDRCQRSFEELKIFLTTTPIVRAPNWQLPFKYLLTKQDAKARLIKWILLFEEFNLHIKDKKGVENVVTDHLSRLATAHNSHGMPINDDFPEEPLMLVEVVLYTLTLQTT